MVMRYKKHMIILLATIFLFAMATASATDSNDTAVAAEDRQLTDEIIQASENQENTIQASNNDEVNLSEDDSGKLAIGNDKKLGKTVTNHTFKAIKDAIESDCTIYLEPGTYTGNSEIYISEKSNITIIGNSTILDAQGQTQIFHIQESSNITIQNIIFKNGHNEGGTGGAIDVYNSCRDCSISNCTFINNHADMNGGAISWFTLCANGRVSNCTFINNTAKENGGAINWYNSNDGRVDNCTFINNTADWEGDAIYANGCDLNADYNWFGNNATNYNDQLPINNMVKCDYRLFLNANANPDTITRKDTSNITFKLYQYHSGVVSDYDNVPFKNLDLTITATKGNVKGTAKLGEPIQFTPTRGGTASVTATMENVHQTVEINVKGDFDLLQDLVNNESLSIINLERNYTYNEFDTITGGVRINRPITINGNGFTIDAKGKSRIFHVTAGSINITDVTLKNGKADSGGAIYFKNAISNSNINATYINNTANAQAVYYDGGGANYFLVSVSGSNISGTYINNTATNGGGANNFGSVLGSNIGGTYINNHANNGGANYFYDRVLNSDISGIYARNNATNGAIISFSETPTNVNIENAIFLNNKYNENNGIIYAKKTGMVAKNNWFGNNATNFETAPKTTGIQMDSWLFLNATADPNSISVFDSSDILFKLYSTNGTHVYGYDNSKLPVVNLTLTATNGEVSNSTPLDKSVEYMPTKVGQGSVTASVEDAEYTIFLDNIGLNPEFSAKVNPQLIDYSENAAIILKYNATATGTVNITLTGKKHNQTIENVALNKTITLPDTILPDEYEVTVSYSGDDVFLNASAASSLTVYQLKSDIKVVGYDIYVNDTTGLMFSVALPENATGNITLNNTITLNVTKEGRKENGSLIIEIKNDAYSVGQYNWTFTYSDDDIYENSQAKSTANILIIPTEITANATSSLFVDDTDQVTYNVTPENAVGNVKFTSNDTSVVEVDQNGNIKAIAEGTAIITVTFEGCENYTASSTNVTVTVSKIATEISIENYTLKLEVNDEVDTGATLTPADAGNVTYAISNSSVVKVMDGKVIALAEGEAAITVSFVGDVKYADAENKTITVNVSLKDASVSVNNDTLDLFVDDTFNLVATTEPKDLTVNFTSSNPSVVTVDNKGNVVAVSEGTANITVKVGGDGVYAENSTTVTVTVSKIPTEIKIDSPVGEMSVGAMGHVAAELIPSDAGNLSYVSNDTSVATVSSTGVIKANMAGTALITVSFAGDDNYAAAENKTITLTVNLNDASVSVNNSTLELLVDDNFTIVATTDPAGLNVTYVPDDSGVVSVDENGIATALKEGTASITVKVGGDGVYVENSTEISITVSKIPAEIIVQNATVDMKVTDEVTPVVSLMPSGAGELDFTSSDVSVVTVDGIGTITAVGEGVANVTVRFIGNDKYAAAESKNITVTVSLKDASVSVNNSTLDLFIDDNFTIVATTTPAGLNVTYVPDNSGVISVDENGEVTALKEGTASIIVKVGGDGTYVENSTIVTVTVNKQDANASVSIPENVTVGDNSTVNVKLPSDAAGNVTVKVDGDVVDTVQVADGSADVTIPPMSAGNHTVEIDYSGDDKYKSTSKTATITVNRDSTNITAADVTATYKVNKYLVIKLTDSRGNPLANAIVTVELTAAKNYTSDENGQIKVKVSNLVPKTYAAKITFKGNDNYTGSNTTAEVTVKKATAKITAKAKTFSTTTKTKKYTIILKDSKGNPIKKAVVSLKVNGNTYKATTNSKGKATFKITKLSNKGTYKATVTFKANKYYKKATKNAKITVKSVWKTVAKGSKNHAIVKKIQRALKSNGYYLSYNGHYLMVDGIYHDYTKMAVKQFQKANGLKVTGKVDEKTAKKLKLI